MRTMSRPSRPGPTRGASLLLLGLLAAALALPAPASTPPAPEDVAPRLLHILDYIGVDYPLTVAGGEVVNPAEYDEQLEFAAHVIALLEGLPDRPERRVLLEQARALREAVAAKRPGAEVTRLTRAMRERIVAAYGVPTAPRSPPDLTRGAALYQEHCQACHGPEGRGNGPKAQELDPPPVDFHDRERAWQRSLFSLYSTITLGVSGTAMRGFAGTLSEEDRWALAFHVGALAFTEEERRQGEALWREGRGSQLINTLGQLTRLEPQQAEREMGAEGVAVLAYLRAHPEALATGSRPIDVALQRLEESLALYRQGEQQLAYDRALSAYLDGLELAEPSLAALDPDLVQRTEKAMLRYRQAIVAASSQDVAIRYDEARQALLMAKTTLEQKQLTPFMGFVTSFVILLREGLEALLLLAAMLAALIKTGRRDALPYFHLGWLGALVLGALTWLVSTKVVELSGAERELTEAVTALAAGAMLLYVGLWMHSRTRAHRWHSFVHGQAHGALSGRTLWALALAAFVAVYREVFETVLFYQALWLQLATGGSTAPLWWGMAAAAAALVVLGWALFRGSLRLPLKLFFNISAVVLLAMALYFLWTGLTELQNLGVLPTLAASRRLLSAEAAG